MAVEEVGSEHRQAATRYHQWWDEGRTSPPSSGSVSSLGVDPYSHYLSFPELHSHSTTYLNQEISTSRAGTISSEFYTSLRYELFTRHSLPLPPGPLKIQGWRALLTNYPNREFVNTLLAIIEYGAAIHDNHTKTNLARDPLTAYPQKQLAANRVKVYDDSKTLQAAYIADIQK
jgi:hypothetical protein